MARVSYSTVVALVFSILLVMFHFVLFELVHGDVPCMASQTPAGGFTASYLHSSSSRLSLCFWLPTQTSIIGSTGSQHQWCGESSTSLVTSNVFFKAGQASSGGFTAFTHQSSTSRLSLRFWLPTQSSPIDSMMVLARLHDPILSPWVQDDSSFKVAQVAACSFTSFLHSSPSRPSPLTWLPKFQPHPLVAHQHPWTCTHPCSSIHPRTSIIAVVSTQSTGSHGSTTAPLAAQQPHPRTCTHCSSTQRTQYSPENQHICCSIKGPAHTAVASRELNILLEPAHTAVVSRELNILQRTSTCAVVSKERQSSRSISPHPPAVIDQLPKTLVSPHPSSFFNSIFTPLHILSATISIFFHSIFFSLVTIKSIASSISSCPSEVTVSLAQCRVLKQHVCVSRAPCTTTKETRRLAPSHARTINSQLQWLFGFLSVS